MVLRYGIFADRRRGGWRRGDDLGCDRGRHGIPGYGTVATADGGISHGRRDRRGFAVPEVNSAAAAQQAMKKLFLLFAAIAAHAQATNTIVLQWEYDAALTNVVGGFRIYSAPSVVTLTNTFPSGWTVLTNIVGLDPSGTNSLPLLVEKSQMFYTMTAYSQTNFWGGEVVESVPSEVVSTPPAPVVPTTPPQRLRVRKGH